MEASNNQELVEQPITLTQDSSLEDRRIVYSQIRALRGKIHWSLEGDWTQPDVLPDPPAKSA